MMALVGRARARLNLGNSAGVVADAARVPLSFVYFADRTPTSAQTENRIFEEIYGKEQTDMNKLLAHQDLVHTIERISKGDHPQDTP